MDYAGCKLRWHENIGDIIFSEDDGEIFWMFPEALLFHECAVISPRFTFDEENWRLMTIPTDSKNPVERYEANKEWIGVFLRNCSMHKREYSVQLGVKGSAGKEMCSHSCEINPHFGFGTWKFWNLDEERVDCPPFGYMKIFCVIRRIRGYPNDMISCSASDAERNKMKKMKTDGENRKSKSESKGLHILRENLRNLLQTGLGSDVILKTNDHEFHAHSIILGARSPVLTSLIQKDMSKKATSEVDISDCPTEGFKIFLEYLYTGNVDLTARSNVSDVYYIADKYQVDHLKFECVERLKSTLSMDNFFDIINMSFRHNETDLQNFAIRFFSTNMEEILESDQWQQFITENPKQATELFIKATNA